MSGRFSPIPWIAGLSVSLLFWSGPGCSSSKGHAESLDSQSADLQARAILALAARSETPPDENLVRVLIDALESDDPAVRFMAIRTLERWKGDTMGYRSIDPPWVRDEAIARWVEAVSDGSQAETMAGETIKPHGSSQGLGEDR